MSNNKIVNLIYDKNNFIKLLIICVLAYIIYLLYYKINEGFVTYPTTTGARGAEALVPTTPGARGAEALVTTSTLYEPNITQNQQNIIRYTPNIKQYQSNNNINEIQTNFSPSTLIYQYQFKGTSNVYAPVIYRSIENFGPLNLFDNKYDKYMKYVIY